MSKRNDALNVLSSTPVVEVPPAPTPTPVAAAVPAPEKVTRLPKADSSAVSKVMLYLPPKVARKFKEIAFHEDCKPHDIYLEALERFLREKGHSTEASQLKTKLKVRNR